MLVQKLWLSRPVYHALQNAAFTFGANVLIITRSAMGSADAHQRPVLEMRCNTVLALPFDLCFCSCADQYLLANVHLSAVFQLVLQEPSVHTMNYF